MHAITRKRLLTAAALLLAVLTLGGITFAAPKDSPWGASYFPNVPLVTQDGKTVRFYEDLLKDKKVLINFIFTQCEQACPLDTAKLAQVQRLLGPRVGREFFMYSITLDPKHDTPEVLKAYAGKFGVGPDWLFLTGAREAIDSVRFKLGQRREKEEHANTVQVGDVARGQWMRLPLTADPNYLLVEIVKTLDPLGEARTPRPSIEAAPRREITEQQRVLLPGQTLFRNRCATCHTIGAGDRIGPDLKGVTVRREPGWIVRYLAAPDKLRASKDPIAVELAKHYPVPMPNLGLTNKELADLLQYLEASTGAQPTPLRSAVRGGDGTAGQERSEGAQSAAAHAHHHQQDEGSPSQ